MPADDQRGLERMTKEEIRSAVRRSFEGAGFASFAEMKAAVKECGCCFDGPLRETAALAWMTIKDLEAFS